MLEVPIFRILIFKIIPNGDVDVLYTAAKATLVKIKGV